MGAFADERREAALGLLNFTKEPTALHEGTPDADAVKNTLGEVANRLLQQDSVLATQFFRRALEEEDARAVDVFQPPVAFRGDHPAGAGGGGQGGDGFVRLFERAREKAGEMGEGGSFDLVLGAGRYFPLRAGPGLGEFHVGQLCAQAEATAAVVIDPRRQVVGLADGDGDGEREQPESFDGLGRRRAGENLAAHAVVRLGREHRDFREQRHEQQLLLENRQLEGRQFGSVLFFRRGGKTRQAGQADDAELFRGRVHPQLLPIAPEGERSLLNRGRELQPVGCLEDKSRLLADERPGQSVGLGDDHARGKSLWCRARRRLDDLGDFQQRGGENVAGRGRVGFPSPGRTQGGQPEEEQNCQADFHGGVNDF